MMNEGPTRIVGAANNEEHICTLCERQRPCFVVESDDMIMRVPERYLSPLLKQLKKDYLAKKQYLRYMRINAKFIKACNCDYKHTHAYCLTALVV